MFFIIYSALMVMMMSVLPAVLPQDSMNADGEERSSEVKQEVAEASQVKDEEEELSIAPDEEPLDVKQEADAAMKTPEGE